MDRVYQAARLGVITFSRPLGKLLFPRLGESAERAADFDGLAAAKSENELDKQV